jgi:putative oxidoreductase
MEASLQRLFTTFADGWPGFGLLFQRLVTGIVLLHQGIVLCMETPKAPAMAPQAIEAVLAIFIILGLWTPAAGALIAAVEVWMAFAHPGDSETAIMLAVLGATLGMIGPGAFSVDARLFGRKHMKS